MKQNPRAVSGARGSEVDPAGRRSDPKSSTPSAQPLDPVGKNTAWAGPEERALRLRMHKARDRAQARAVRTKHSRARAAYWLAAQFAGDWVFQRAPIEDLEEVVKGLTWAFLLAGLFERLEDPDEQ